MRRKRKWKVNIMEAVISDSRHLMVTIQSPEFQISVSDALPPAKTTTRAAQLFHSIILEDLG